MQAIEIYPEDPDDDWAVAAPGRGIRIRAITGILVGLAVLAGGFWGGVLAEKHHGTGSTTVASAASRFAAARSAAGGTGAGAGAAGFGAATTGTVVGVKGDILYVSNASGALVKVTVSPSTTVTRTAKSSLSGLQTGDTVVVEGSASSNGSVTATSVRASAQGVTTGTGGFTGGGFGGAGG